MEEPGKSSEKKLTKPETVVSLKPGTQSDNDHAPGTGGHGWTDHGDIWSAPLLSMIAVVPMQNMLAQAVNGQHEEDFHVMRSGRGWRT